MTPIKMCCAVVVLKEMVAERQLMHFFLPLSSKIMY